LLSRLSPSAHSRTVIDQHRLAHSESTARCPISAFDPDRSMQHICRNFLRVSRNQSIWAVNRPAYRRHGSGASERLQFGRFLMTANCLTQPLEFSRIYRIACILAPQIETMGENQ
jgi:hypothetical protein